MDFTSLKRKELQALCKEHGIRANLTNVEMATRLTALLKGKQVKGVKSCLKNLEIGVFNDDDENEKVGSKEGKRVRFSPQNETFEFEKTDPREWRLLARKRRVAMSKIGTAKDPVLVAEEVSGVDEAVGGKNPKRNLRRRSVVDCETESENPIDIGDVQRPVGRNLRTRSMVKIDAVLVSQDVSNVSGVEGAVEGKNKKRNSRRRPVVNSEMEIENTVHVGDVQKPVGRNLRRRTMVKKDVVFVSQDVSNVEKPAEREIAERNLRRKSVVKSDVVLTSQDVDHVEKLVETENLNRNLRSRGRKTKQNDVVVALSPCVEKKAKRGRKGDRVAEKGGVKGVDRSTDEMVDDTGNNLMVTRRQLRSTKVTAENSSKVDDVAVVERISVVKKGVTEKTEKVVQVPRRSARQIEDAKARDCASVSEGQQDIEVSDQDIGKKHRGNSTEKSKKRKRGHKQALTAKQIEGIFREVVDQQNASIESPADVNAFVGKKLRGRATVLKDVGEGNVGDIKVLEDNAFRKKNQNVKKDGGIKSMHVTRQSTRLGKTKFDDPLTQQVLDDNMPLSSCHMKEGKDQSDQSLNQVCEASTCSMEMGNAVGNAVLSHKEAVTGQSPPESKKSEKEVQYHASGGSILMEHKTEKCKGTIQCSSNSSLHLYMANETTKSEGYESNVSIKKTSENGEANAGNPANNEGPAPSLCQNSSDDEANCSEQTSNCCTDGSDPVTSRTAKPTMSGTRIVIDSAGELSSCSVGELGDEERDGKKFAVNQEAEPCNQSKIDQFSKQVNGVEESPSVREGSENVNAVEKKILDTAAVIFNQLGDEVRDNEKFVNYEGTKPCNKRKNGELSKQENGPEAEGSPCVSEGSENENAAEKKMLENPELDDQLKVEQEAAGSRGRGESSFREADSTPEFRDSQGLSPFISADKVLVDAKASFSTVQKPKDGGEDDKSVTPSQKWETGCSTSNTKANMVESQIKDSNEVMSVSSPAINTASLIVHLQYEAKCVDSSECTAPQNCDVQELNQCISAEKVVVACETSVKANVQSPMIVGGLTPSEASVLPVHKPIEEGEDDKTVTPSLNGEIECSTSNREANIVESQIKDSNEDSSESLSAINISSLFVQLQAEGELTVHSSSLKKKEVTSSRETIIGDLSCSESGSKLNCSVGNDKSLTGKYLEEARNLTDPRLQHLVSQDDLTNSDESKELEYENTAVVTDVNELLSGKGENRVLVQDRKRDKVACEGNTLPCIVDSVRNEVSESVSVVSVEADDFDRSFTRAAEDPEDNLFLYEDDSANPVQVQDREPLQASYPGKIIASNDGKCYRNATTVPRTKSNLLADKAETTPLGDSDKSTDLKRTSYNYLVDFMEKQEMHTVSHAADLSPLITKDKINQCLENPCDNIVAQGSDGTNMGESQLSDTTHLHDENELVEEKLEYLAHQTGSFEVVHADISSSGYENPKRTDCSNSHDAFGEGFTWQTKSVDSAEKGSLAQQRGTLEDARGGLSSCGNKSLEYTTVAEGEFDEGRGEGFGRKSTLFTAVQEEAKNDGAEKITEESCMAENENGHKVGMESSTCNSHLEVDVEISSLEGNSGKFSLEDTLPTASDADIEKSHSGESMPLKDDEDGKGNMVHCVVENEDDMLPKSAMVDEIISEVVKNDRHDGPENPDSKELVAAVRSGEMVYQDLGSHPFSAIHQENLEGMKGDCDVDLAEAKACSTMVGPQFGGNEKGTDENAGALQDNIEKGDVLPLESAVHERTSESLTNEVHDKSQNTGDENVVETVSLREGSQGFYSSQLSDIDWEAHYVGFKDNCDADQAEANDIVCSAIVEPQMFCSSEKETDEIQGAFQDTSAVRCLPSIIDSVRTREEHVTSEANEHGEENTSQDACMTGSDNLALERPEELQSSPCDVAEVSNVSNTSHGKLNNYETTVEHNGEQGDNMVGQQTINDEQLDHHIYLVREDSCMIASDHLASERPEGLQGSPRGVDEMGSAPEHIHHCENEALNDNTEELDCGQGMSVKDDDYEKGFSATCVEKEADILPPSPMLNATHLDAASDMHEYPESTSNQKLADVSGVKEMEHTALRKFSMSDQVINPEVDERNCEEVLVEAKEDGFSIPMEELPFFNMPENKGSFFDASGDRRLDSVDCSVGKRNSAVNIADGEHGECGEVCPTTVELFPETAEMGIESDLEGGNKNDYLNNREGAVLSRPSAFEDFADQPQQYNASPVRTTYQQSNSTNSSSAVSASISVLHGTAEDKDQKYDVESCIFSSWDIDLLWGEMTDEGVNLHDKSISVQQHGQQVGEQVTTELDKAQENSREENSDCLSANEPAENKVMARSTSMIKKMNSRSILIHGTPKKPSLFIHDMKENTPAVKTRQMVDVTAVKPLLKRKALEDIQK